MKKKNIFKIIRNWNNPFFIRDALINKLAAIIYKRNKGNFIVDEQWDNLIILDACRYDIFKEIIDSRNIQGNLLLKKSRGSHTISFLLENFRNGKYLDTVYITANPYVNRVLKNKFFKIISVWKDGWDVKEKTVLPKTMFDYTIEAKKNYPQKKLIIHFMQPHYPYIGYNFDINKKKKKNPFFTLYTARIYSSIDKKNHIKAYRNNLELAMDFVEKLLRVLPGTTVITSDHGESFGERIFPILPFKLFGHHRRFKIPVLLKVPWFESKSLYEKPQISSSIDEKTKIKEIVQNFEKDKLIGLKKNALN